VSFIPVWSREQDFGVKKYFQVVPCLNSQPGELTIGYVIYYCERWVNYLSLNVEYFVVRENVHFLWKLLAVKSKLLISKPSIEILGKSQNARGFPWSRNSCLLKGNSPVRPNRNNAFELVELSIPVEPNLL